ncbi:sensor histidine kinase [Sutcliffiella cohnii]
MNIIQRYVVIGFLISLLSLITIGAILFYSFPFMNWASFWEVKVFDLPLILFSSCIIFLIGIITGLLSGVFEKKQWQTVYDQVTHIEQGRGLMDKQAVPELDMVQQILHKINMQMKEQAKLAQKLANEKAVDMENRVQEIISQERNRLARELHDSVSQQLFAASMLMSAITENNSELAEYQTKQLLLVEQMIQQSQLEMRALLLHLRPVALKGKTLQEGIEELLIELQHKIPMELSWKLEKFRMDKGVEDHLFRIVQESFSNSLRHSKAASLEVLLIERDQFIILRIEDDGIGFDVESEKAGSYGLQNMYDRALEIGGVMKIVSVKGQGTRLEVKVPKIDLKGEDDD